MKESRTTTAWWLVALGLCLSLSSCSPLAPRPDLSKFYTLAPIGGTTAASSATGLAPLTVGLGPVRLPDYLNRPQVVTRVAPNQLELSEIDRWAGPLDKDFNRMLNQDLSQQLGNAVVVDYPWNRSTPIDYAVEINVAHFESNAGKEAALQASWLVRDSNNKVLTSSSSDIRKPIGSGEGAAAGALSSALGDLSTQIATAIRDLQAQHRSPRA